MITLILAPIVALVVVPFVLARLRRFTDRSKTAFVYPADVPVAEAQAAAEGYLHRSIVALDIFLNVVGLKGEQDETMSTHAWRASLRGHAWGKVLNFWLNGFQAEHGPQAASGDLWRAAVRVSVLTKALGVKDGSTK